MDLKKSGEWKVLWIKFGKGRESCVNARFLHRWLPFGFNGKLKDNEIKGTGNSYDYGMRMYDPRIARFPTPDPLTKEYPELTPYQYASNSPIQNIDIDGLEGGNANVAVVAPAASGIKQKSFR